MCNGLTADYQDTSCIAAHQADFMCPHPVKLLPWTPHLLATPAFSSAGNNFYVCGVYASQKEGTKASHLPEVEQ